MSAIPSIVRQGPCCISGVEKCPLGQKGWDRMEVGQRVEWLTRPIPGGYLHGVVVKVGPHKIGIAVQSPKTGQWKPKWVNADYLRKIEK